MTVCASGVLGCVPSTWDATEVGNTTQIKKNECRVSVSNFVRQKLSDVTVSAAVSPSPIPETLVNGWQLYEQHSYRCNLNELIDANRSKYRPASCVPPQQQQRVPPPACASAQLQP
jgi:hypothetical protein